MFDKIMSFLGAGVQACLNWFDQILTATGMYGFVLAFIFMFLSFRFLILPFVGGRGVGSSDSVKDSKKGSVQRDYDDFRDKLPRNTDQKLLR